MVLTARRPGGLQALPPGRAHVLVEPLDRGSAASILFPVHWIHARDPEATVVVFGDDPPRIAPGFGHQIAQATRHAESLILLGLAPDEGEPERGFIVPGERIDSTERGRSFAFGISSIPIRRTMRVPAPGRCAMAASSRDGRRRSSGRRPSTARP